MLANKENHDILKLSVFLLLVDITGKAYIYYKYNSWGKVSKSINPLLEEGDIELAQEVLDINPFIYKGYYYDDETGLYWCTTRFYDPEIGRWISPDALEYLEPNRINGLNLYSYCGNDPINRVDPLGTSWWNPFSWSAKTWMTIGSVGLMVGGVL